MTDFRVDFLGSGYECVRFVHVVAPTPGDALQTAMEWYLSSDQDFDFIGLEIQGW